LYQKQLEEQKKNMEKTLSEKQKEGEMMKQELDQQKNDLLFMNQSKEEELSKLSQEKK